MAAVLGTVIALGVAFAHQAVIEFRHILFAAMLAVACVEQGGRRPGRRPTRPC